MNKMYNSWDDFFSEIEKNQKNINIKTFNDISNMNNYDLLSNKNKIDTHINYEKSLINIVIPYKNREKLIKSTIYSLLENDFQDFIITIVEYSEKNSYEMFNDLEKTNFIWIPSKKNEFNKSLCMNIGSMYVDSDFILFHDSDLVVESDFLSSVLSYINEKSLLSIQTFSEGNILNLSEFQTLKFLSNKNYLNEIKNTLDCLYTKMPPGGSIMIKKFLFEKIGGFDDNVFEDWGHEDAIFKLKIESETNCTLENTKNPIVKVFHLYHEKLPEKEDNFDLFSKIFNFNKDDLKNFICNQSKRFENMKKIIVG